MRPQNKERIVNEQGPKCSRPFQKPTLSASAFLALAMAANSLHGATCRLQGKKSTPPDDPKQPQTSECRATQTERNLRQPWRPYIKQTIALQTLGNTNAGSSIHSRCIGTTHTRAKRMQNGAFFTTSSSQSSYSNDCREPRAQYLIYTQQKLQQGPVPANFCIALLRKETSQRQHPPSCF